MLHESTIGPDDVAATIRDVGYHLEYPVARPVRGTRRGATRWWQPAPTTDPRTGALRRR